MKKKLKKKTGPSRKRPTPKPRSKNNGDTDFVMMNVETLVPAPYNPRIMDGDGERALKASLDKWGLLENLIWNKRTGHIVGGHQRLKILKEAGIKQVPIKVVDISEAEEKEMNLVLNNENIGGQWEALKLAKLKEEIQRTNPAVYDNLLIFKLKGEVVEEGVDEYDKLQAATLDNHPEMEMFPYEHWDYIFVIFDDYRDFQVAIQKLGLKMVNHSLTSKKKIGLGRCIKGKRLLELLK